MVLVATKARPFGETGDLSDALLVFLCLAKMKHHVRRVAPDGLTLLYLQLQREFREVLPELSDAEYFGEYVSSRTINRAFIGTLGLGADLTGTLRYLEVLEPSSLLVQLQRYTGKEFVEMLKPVAKRFAELAKELELVG